MSRRADQFAPHADGRRLLKRASNSMQADVWLVGEGNGARVLKDVSRHAAVWRALWGRRLLRREVAALEATATLEIGPRFICWSDEDAFEMSCVPGTRLPRRKETPQPDGAVFDRLAAAVAAMHAAGVAHGDLRRTNVFWEPSSGAVHLIDFGTAAVSGAQPGWWRRFHFRTARNVDVRKLAKLRREYLDADGADSAADAYPWYLRLGRFVRQRVYRPLKHLRERLFRGD